MRLQYVKIAEQKIQVELAITAVEQAQGLSGRQVLNDNEGMLFVFDSAGKHSFWMKDMNFPIDIIWFTPSEGGAGNSMKVVYIKKYAEPESFPEMYSPDVDAKYVLEVVAGFSEKNNLKAGDQVIFLSK